LDRKEKYLYENDKVKKATNINPYLIDAPNVYIESRNNPICKVPKIGIGNKPIDDGNYLFTEEEMKEFVKKESNSEKWFRLWLGAQEFINSQKRYCLFIKNCPPNELRNMPEVIKRVENVKAFRLKSKSPRNNKACRNTLKFSC